MTNTRKLPEHSFRQHVHVNTIWAAFPDTITTFEDVINPQYWAHIESRLTIGDKIFVTPEDGTYYAELYVKDKQKFWVETVVLCKHDLTQVVDTPKYVPLEYDIRWCGGAKFRVIRRSDKATLQDGFATKDVAEAWVREYITKIVRVA